MLPVLEDLIDMAESFTEKLEGMSDAEKENIGCNMRITNHLV